MNEQEKRVEIIGRLQRMADSSLEHMYLDSEAAREAVAILNTKEPKDIKDAILGIDGWGGNCPRCGSFVVRHSNPNYCGVCGQAVKWA